MSENSSPSVRETASGFKPAKVVFAAALVASLALNLWLAGEAVRSDRNITREHDFWVLCQPGATATEREGAFRRLVRDGNREWRAANLHGLNFAGIQVPGASLQNVALVRANLAGAKLDGAALSGSTLELADLTGATFDQANLTETRLQLAILKNATLRGARLCAGHLEQIQAENADFEGADLADANCRLASFAGAKLVGANLAGAKLESANLKGANLSLARLEGADLTDADFTNANWWAARGLTTPQLAMLKKKFPPTETAGAALKEDFARWAAAGPR